MPTGYTADVQSGKVIKFADFAMQCARAFGALVTMRDEPTGAQIPERFVPSKYNKERLAEAKKQLTALERMSPSEIETARDQEFADAMAYFEKREKERIEQKERYEAMLAQVRAWMPPSTDHADMKKFMEEQLIDSIDFDCGHPLGQPEKMTAKAWHEEALRKARWNVEYHSKEWAQEQERVAKRNEWLRLLRESLEAV